MQYLGGGKMFYAVAGPDIVSISLSILLVLESTVFVLWLSLFFADYNFYYTRLDRNTGFSEHMQHLVLV